jgi:hypothetical protein
MKAASPTVRLTGTPRTPHPTAGFTLFELVLTLLAIALAIHIAFTEIGKFRHRADRDQFVEELGILAGVFENHWAQHGEWPPATHPEARMPRGMEPALAHTRWLAGPPFGGSYDWIPPAAPGSESQPKGPMENSEAAKSPPPPGAIAVTAFSPFPPLPLTLEDLLYIDARLDDGNLSTGRFRSGCNRWPVYAVNPAP